MKPPRAEGKAGNTKNDYLIANDHVHAFLASTVFNDFQRMLCQYLHPLLPPTPPYDIDL